MTLMYVVGWLAIFASASALYKRQYI